MPFSITTPHAASTAAMMRIAIAGAGGFAAVLALHISETANPIVILSREPQPEFEQQYECQVAVVDYDDDETLKFVLQGIDIVISTIRGQEQINLIKAARNARVRLFVPAEFEGCLSRRPSSSNHPLDFGSSEAIELLKHCASSKSKKIEYTVFSCGILYERFAPGGLEQYGMGMRENIQAQGSYLVDVGNCTADIVETNSQGRPVQVSMTSVADVGRFIAAALDIGPGNWPREFKMRGDRMSVRDIFANCSNVRGVAFSLRTRKCSKLSSDLAHYAQRQNWDQWWNIQRLIATAEGRYDFRQADLNEAVDFQPVSFRSWLEAQWGSG
ncbi:isoflavone reductase family protein [Colletotrichum karsti]|uniref:Isoflavone reductase family protein n=1 Tax=Colletotrichum karsti TaxID=1095194 RepID=A0A9P6IGE3_9PEZI|nr:isoflavone reductase family protein [Colletotrichum karsti]KAF9881992.1 isoflavone reductase family protein [Colletotrichum karsti]